MTRPTACLGDSEADGEVMCGHCDCPLECAFSFSDARLQLGFVGCYRPPEGCCGRSHTMCQGLPHGSYFLVFASVLALLLTLLFALVLAAVHSAHYMCGNSASCSTTCCVASPLVLLGGGVHIFDWLTDANFYLTLARGDKGSAPGYACLVSLGVSGCLLLFKLCIESCSCKLFDAELELSNTSRDYRSAAPPVKSFWIQTCRWLGCSTKQPAGSIPYIDHETLAREAAMLEARELAFRLRSWHLTTQAKLCVAILLVEDLPELIFMASLRKLNFVDDSSRASLIGVALSASWAAVQLYRGSSIAGAGQRAGRRASAVKSAEAQARGCAMGIELADAIFHPEPTQQPRSQPPQLSTSIPPILSEARA